MRRIYSSLILAELGTARFRAALYRLTALTTDLSVINLQCPVWRFSAELVGVLRGTDLSVIDRVQRSPAL
jgi:hypothetical protein